MERRSLQCLCIIGTMSLSWIPKHEQFGLVLPETCLEGLRVFMVVGLLPPGLLWSMNCMRRLEFLRAITVVGIKDVESVEYRVQSFCTAVETCGDIQLLLQVAADGNPIPGVEAEKVSAEMTMTARMYMDPHRTILTGTAVYGE